MHRSILLGLGHGINDFISGFLLATLFFYMDATLMQKGMAALLYNLVAFGGQTMVARSHLIQSNTKASLHLCLILLIISLYLMPYAYPIAILFAGVSSAIIHVVGAAEATEDAAISRHLGIFLSPGVIGLALGSYVGYLSMAATHYAAISCLIYIGLLFFLFKPQSVKESKKAPDNPPLDQHDIGMILIIMVLCFRSFVWDILILVQQENYPWLLAIASAAALGKIVGGFASDKIGGHLKYSIGALVCALAIFIFGHNQLWALSLGALFLQSTFAPLTVLLIASFKNDKLQAIAWSLGLTILFPILFLFSNIPFPHWWTIAIALSIAVALLYFLLKRKQKALLK